MTSRVWLALVAIVCFFLAGCSGGGPPLGKVSGTVTLDGQPLEGAAVQFDPGNVRPASGTTDSQGRYELVFTSESKGAVLGTNTVRIYPKTSDEAGDNLPASEIVEIPAKYNTESTLTAEVKEGDNTFDFALTSE
jgi:hypothetical protein